MNLKNLILIIKRHLVSILVIMSITTAFSAVFYYQYSLVNSTNATIFINIGSKEKIDSVSSSSTYDQVQAADMFTETIQGWFKNKDLLSRIEKQSTVPASITAKKQEKQNLLITFRARNEQLAKKVVQSVQENLLAEIGTYNRSTGSAFQITLFSVTYEQSSTSMLLIVIVLGMILGAGLGLILNLIFELLTNKIIYDCQAEQELGMNALEKLPSKLNKKRQLNYLTALINKIPGRNFSIIGLGFNPGNVIESLSSVCDDRKFTGLMFPEESMEIINRHGTDHLIVAKLGISTIDDLKKIKILLAEKYYLIIQE